MTGLVSSGAVAAAVGLAIFPGADICPAVMAKILLIRLSVLDPRLLLVGVGLFMRIQEGRVENIGTSNIHYETRRTLKCVNLFFSMVAHLILMESGGLLESRLADKV